MTHMTGRQSVNERSHSFRGSNRYREQAKKKKYTEKH